MVTRDFLLSLPTNPGVYIMKDKQDKIIYVGKAKNLKNRVGQYFRSHTNHTPKVIAMVERIDHLEYILTNSEVEALNLECSLIKKHRPKYNILLKDDKGYPYIKITDEPFPQLLLVHRKEEDGSRYFGPYVTAFAAKQTVDLLRKTFLLRDCKGDIGKKNGCLQYHIGRCSAPCLAKISKEAYHEAVQQAASVLGGKIDGLVDDLKTQMEQASEHLAFETAAQLRDKIFGIRKMMQKQVVVSVSGNDEDVVCLYKESDIVCMQMLYVRDGKLTDKQAFFMNNVKDETDEDVMQAFLLQYYSRFAVPTAVHLSLAPTDPETVEAFLTSQKGKKVKLAIPQRGDKVRFLEMAKKNAMESIRLKIEGYGKKTTNMEAVEQLKQYLGLDFVPVRIEAYDISNTSGEQTTGSMVVFEKGVANKSMYRKFKIKAAAKKDDYDAMREMVERRLSHEQDKKFPALPDLILVDGGMGHVHAITPIAAQYGIPVYGIVKDDKHRTRDLVSGEKEFLIPIGTKCFRLATNIQDEMHRVAITYHRQLRAKKNLESELLQIEGVGKATFTALIGAFKTIHAISNATVEQLCEVKRVSRRTAENIFNHYHKSL